MKPKVVFFDAGGTLFRPYPSVGAVYADTAAKHGVQVNAEEIEKRFHEVWHHRNGLASLVGASSEKIEREWWYGVVKDVFGGTTFKDYDAFFHELHDRFARAECWRLYDDSLPVLDHLKAKGYRLGMISNWDHRLFGIVEDLGLAPYFEAVLASSAVGVAKPGEGIFRAALQRLQVLPAEAVHIGDSLEDDYHGAQRVGMQAVLLDRHRKAYNDVERVESLREFISRFS